MVGERSFAIYCSNNYLVAHKHKQTLWNFTRSFNRCRAVVCCFPLHSWKCETLENRSLNDCSPWKKRRQQHEKTFLLSSGWTFVCVHVLLVIDTQSFIISFFVKQPRRVRFIFLFIWSGWNSLSSVFVWFGEITMRLKRNVSANTTRIVGGHDFIGTRIFIRDFDSTDVSKIYKSRSRFKSIWI